MAFFNGKVMTARVSKSDNLENIDGNLYGYIKIAEVNNNGVDYVLYGDENSEEIYLVTWTHGKYSYVVVKTVGMSKDEIVSLCKNIN